MKVCESKKYSDYRHWIQNLFLQHGLIPYSITISPDPNIYEYVYIVQYYIRPKCVTPNAVLRKNTRRVIISEDEFFDREKLTRKIRLLGSALELSTL